MRTWNIDGSTLQTRKQLHEAAAQALVLPEYYGRNLDALFDCLCECGEETVVTVQNTDALQRNLGRYGKALLLLLEQAGQNNPSLTVTIQPDDA